MKPLKRIAVTGGAGQIAYSLLFRIAAGEMLGPDQPIALHILEVPTAMQALEGVKMELEDCAFPLLKEIRINSDPFEGFGDIDYALLVGAKPRGPGMERKELLQENGVIFTTQGRALNATAKKDATILVVGNPCNTNCLITLSHAPRIPRKNFHAMTRLDQNRAKSLLAKRANADISAVTRLIIWGNHSSTQVPDFTHAYINEKPAIEVLRDETWLKQDFFSLVQKRGAEIIQARGKSSAASAASAAIDAVRSLIEPLPLNDCFSSGVYSAGNPYGIDQELVFSFPCRRLEENRYAILEGLSWDEFLESKIRETERELQEERQLVAHLLHGDN